MPPRHPSPCKDKNYYDNNTIDLAIIIVMKQVEIRYPQKSKPILAKIISNLGKIISNVI